LPGRSLDEPPGHERQDHLMYGRRRNLKVLLHLGLGGRASVDSSVVIDEGQVLALFGGIGFLHLHPYNEATPNSCFKQGSANELPMGWQ